MLVARKGDGALIAAGAVRAVVTCRRRLVTVPAVQAVISLAIALSNRVSRSCRDGEWLFTVRLAAWLAWSDANQVFFASKEPAAVSESGRGVAPFA